MTFISLNLCFFIHQKMALAGGIRAPLGTCSSFTFDGDTHVYFKVVIRLICRGLIINDICHSSRAA